MGYYIYDKDTTELLTSRLYDSVRTARGQLTRMANKNMLPPGKTVDNFDIADNVDFHEKIEKEVERRNYMTGEKFMEPINTPYYCSPRSETYWSS